MNNLTDTRIRPGFTRCAVGKIDLKGRFVYVDDEIEQLMGYSKEELFGCQLADFLDEPSRELVEQLLAHRNHYESFYDATVLTLVNKQGLPVSTRTIVTLNFIAGNPVNFQMVMEAAGNGASSADSPGADHLPVEEFIDALLEAGTALEARDLLSLIREFAGAVQGSLYLIEGDRLEPRAGSSADGALEFAFRDIPEPDDLHRHIASEGGEYAFTDGDSVQDGVAVTGVAPNEYISLLPRIDGESHLLRLVFAADTPHASAAAAVDRARLAVKLWQHEVQLANLSRQPADAEIDLQFTVGFLDHLGIGAALIDAAGAVIGYNRSLTEIAETDQPGDDCHQLSRLLTDGSPHEDGLTLESYFSARREGAEAGDLRLEVALSDQRTAELAVVALSDQPGDLSTCMILMPSGQAGSPNAAGGHQFWLSILDALRAPLAAVVENASALGHELHNRAGEKGNDRIRTVAEAAGAIEDAVKDASELVQAGFRPPELETVDLSLLVNEAFEEVRQGFPKIEAVCRIDDLPKVRTYPTILRRGICSLLFVAFRFHSDGILQLAIESTFVNGECCLALIDNGRGITAQEIERIFQYSCSNSEDKSCGQGSGGGLGLARQLLRTVGGEIELDSDPAEGTRGTVRIPAESIE